jgi:uncharacterized protein YeaO (DUF488 family)
MKREIKIKRAYDPAEKSDGTRVLVDRLWPRGIKKEDAALDEWMKDLAPSTELRKWFNHDPERFSEFRRRYNDELKSNDDALKQLLKTGRTKRLTLIYSAHDEEHNQAVVLAEHLRKLN